ncbi:MAG: hypothetical protein EPO25_07430 [Gammaproteobacteria bacterium]|jgi:hypothetical protein|nr:MAG: hypothetical protein EPO25_07430 [Gammaproteobacteria bacterium]
MRSILIAALATLATATAQAACIYPRAPEQLPDGNTASYDEMVAAQQAVRQFNEDITAYNTCLDLEMKSFEESGLYDEARLTELRAMQAKKNNSAVDEVEAIVSRFNEQLRAFKVRDKK